LKPREFARNGFWAMRLRMRKLTILLAFWAFIGCDAVSAMGWHEYQRSLSRIAYSKDGERLLFDANDKIFELDTSSLTLKQIGGDFLYSPAYADDGTSIIAGYLDSRDRDRLFGKFHIAVNPEAYSGLVILKNGNEVSRFAADGFVSSPVFFSRQGVVVYLKDLQPKGNYDSFSSFDPLAGKAVFRNSIDGLNETTFVPSYSVERHSWLQYAPAEDEAFLGGSSTENGARDVGRISLERDGVTPTVALSGQDRPVGVSAFAIGTESSTNEPVVIERQYADGPVVRHLIYKVRTNGDRETLGVLSYNPFELTTTGLGMLTANDRKQRIAFFLRYPGNSWGEAPRREIFLVNYDGSGFVRLVLDFASMKASLEKVGP
jgi:hypothetical protein